MKSNIKLSKIKEFLYGKEIPTRIGMFKNKKGEKVAILGTSSRICYGFVSEKNITFNQDAVLDNMYFGSFSESLIESLEKQGLIFIEITNFD